MGREPFVAVVVVWIVVVAVRVLIVGAIVVVIASTFRARIARVRIKLSTYP